MKSRRWQLAVFVTGAVALIAAPVIAYVLNGYRWPGTKPRVPFYVSTNLDGEVPWDGTLQDAIAAINNAADEWNTRGDADFKFVYAGTTNISTVADDGTNVVMYSPTQSPWGFGSTAVCNYHLQGNTYKGFDVVLYRYQANSGTQVWWSTKPVPQGWEKDVWSTVLHELGHALGLNHSDHGTVVMGTLCGNGCTKRFLYADDIAGIQALYGAYTNEGFWASANSPQPGTWVTLSLDYGAADSGLPYEIYVSRDGSSPGLTLANNFCPNDNDSRILFVNPPFLDTSNPTLFQGFTGTLDAQGRATAQMFTALGDCTAQYSLGALVKSNGPNPCAGSKPPSGIHEVSVPVTITPQTTPLATYCTAKINSQGCLPAIASSGSPSASSGSPFTISATNVLNNKSGLMLYGFSAAAMPFQGGYLCAAPPIRRTPVQVSGGNPPPNDCSGTYSIDFNARIQSGVDPQLIPGASVFTQWWSRDKDSPSTTGLTNALAFTVCN